MNLTAEPINRSDEHLLSIRNLVIDVPALQRSGYVVYKLSGEEIQKKRRCFDCSKALSKHDLRHSAHPKTPAPITLSTSSSTSTSPLSHEAATRPEQSQRTGNKKDSMKRCRFHSGRVNNRYWTCCQKPIMAQPCCSRDEHSPRHYRPGELEANWLYHQTPSPPPSKGRSLISPAVVIDCEMGTADSGETELIRLSLIDFYSGRVLLDKLVFPDCKMAHYNTRFSGVSRAMMNEARRARTCIFGRAKARQEVWRFVGPDTIVVGHGANGDMSSLRWIHHTVIDTLLLEQNWVRRQELIEERRLKEEALQKEKEAREAGIILDDGQLLQGEGEGEGEDEDEGGVSVEKKAVQPKPPMSLKALSKERLNRIIQINGQGHDSVEDAIATRDLLQWYILNRTTPSQTPQWHGHAVHVPAQDVDLLI